MRCDASSAAGADGQTGRDQQAAVICPMPGQLRNNDVLLAIRHLADAYLSAVTAIVLGLPDCFTTDVPGQIERDAAGQDSWVLTDVGTVAGFAVAARRPLGGTEILWIAVDPARRGQRIDTALLDRVPVELVAAVVSVVEAKTLAARPATRRTRPPGRSGSTTGLSRSTPSRQPGPARRGRTADLTAASPQHQSSRQRPVGADESAARPHVGRG